MLSMLERMAPPMILAVSAPPSPAFPAPQRRTEGTSEPLEAKYSRICRSRDSEVFK